MLGQKPSKTRHWNANILSFWFSNCTIQNSIVIYSCRNTTFIKGPARDKTWIHKQNLPNLLVKNRARLDIETQISWASAFQIARFKIPESSIRVGLQLSWRVQRETKPGFINRICRNLLVKNRARLDIETRISWASGFQIARFKIP